MIKVSYAPGRARGEGKLTGPAVKKVAEAVSKALSLKEDFPVSIALIDSPAMQRINKEFRGKDKVTDVLAFQYDEPEAFGEVLICPAYAREQAKDVGRLLHDEMIELLVHGLLHVFGYDHIKPTDAKKMLPLQERIVKKLI